MFFCGSITEVGRYGNLLLKRTFPEKHPQLLKQTVSYLTKAHMLHKCGAHTVDQCYPYYRA